MAKEKTEKATEVKTTEVDNSTLTEVLEGMKAMREENAKLQSRIEELSKEKRVEGNDDIVSAERKPADNMTLVVIDGKPIIDMQLEPEMAVDHKGNEYMRRMQATCHVFGKKEPVHLSYGEISNPKDFLNLPRKKFKLINQDPSELSGASKILRNQVVDNFGTTPEIDRSSGTPVRTGKMVELVTRKSIRYYTIDVDGEACELHEDKIYR